MAAHTAEVVRNSICASPSRTVRTADMAAAHTGESMVGIAPRRATVGRVEHPTMAADVPRAEADIPPPEVAVDTSVVAAEAAIPVAGDTLAAAIDKFETYGRVEVSRKLL